jgi:hypothetical protein
MYVITMFVSFEKNDCKLGSVFMAVKSVILAYITKSSGLVV